MQDAGEFVPFAVFARVTQLPSLFFEPIENDNFSLEFLYGLRGGRLIDNRDAAKKFWEGTRPSDPL